MEITCPEVQVSDGKITAKLVFDSPNYTYVKYEGTQFDRTEEESTENSSVFYVDLVLDKELPIQAQTIAMSEPHEIEYQIYVSSEAAEAADAGKGTAGSASAAAPGANFLDPKQIEGLTYVSEMELDYAKQFHVYNYEEGFKLIQVEGSAQYLLVPEGGEAPQGISGDVVLLQAPLDHIYLAATGVMSLFYAMGGEDTISLSGTDADGWNIEGPGDAIRAGKMKFAGKYSAPDYEMMISEGCDLAVESTMILHSPDVQEKLEDLGIPVFVDYSSYEMEPLGRTEWIKAYGALLNREDAAERFFDQQKELVEAVLEKASAGTQEKKSVAVFSITSAKTVSVRKSDDYIPRMIEIAGGEYVFQDLSDEESRGGTAKVSMEEFYNTAGDADYLIYNATIENPLKDVVSLIDKDSLFSDFKAVQEDQVYQIGKDLYQSTDIVGLLTQDIYIMLTNGDTNEFTFLEKLE